MIPSVAIIIANWNGLHYLKECLPTIFQQTYHDFSVWIVDNGSTDGSVLWLKQSFPHVHLIANNHNRGFATANNQAIRSTQTQFIATLNNDTKLESNWLAELVAVMESNPKIGAIAPKMLLASRPEIIDSAGIAIDKAGIAWGVHGGQHDNKMERQRLLCPVPVFGACAGAALYRRAMFDDIGLFDEDFFAYLEDVDLAWRGQWADWQAVYIPQAIVYHLHSGTSKEGSAFKNRLLGRNKIWLLAKNYPFSAGLKWLPYVLMYEIMSIGYRLPMKHGLASIQGRMHGILNLRGMIAKRQHIKRRISAQEMMARLHPIENPFNTLKRYPKSFS
ncbi:MAG: hypothetical protein B6242_00545 [Anaerolineaceae bacterium 4572_78]|nr:MAG: hypothetical protein B6242_00545 [Anaerolineaceae bacterium 4572_78]